MQRRLQHKVPQLRLNCAANIAACPAFMRGMAEMQKLEAAARMATGHFQAVAAAANPKNHRLHRAFALLAAGNRLAGLALV